LITPNLLIFTGYSLKLNHTANKPLKRRRGEMSTIPLPKPIRLPSMPILLLIVLWDTLSRMLREILWVVRYELKNAWYAVPTWVDRWGHQGRHTGGSASVGVWDTLTNLPECEYVMSPRGQHRLGTGYDAMRITERARSEREWYENELEERQFEAEEAFRIECANLRSAINDLEWGYINLQEWYIDRWLENVQGEVLV